MTFPREDGFEAASVATAIEAAAMKERCPLPLPQPNQSLSDLGHPTERAT
eukprot:CAMPEP_0171768428 /NCGR_PEP_ID=MMETSP0991-20121206/52385_1 /TAXON_ID=483369 /ORGANISM="non described non described, Strain CCMP2098" /LENGTH=49 /DNA_ID=CAMNT_0012373359 /DNA_START=514 /DNA_END=663 /DNA_ORIENTATION=+